MTQNQQSPRRSLLWLAAGLSAGTLTAALYKRYHSDLATYQGRLLAGSQVAMTAAGPIEYADQGQGPAVLIIHGAGGGYDQGLLVGRYLGPDVRLIAPSRFGYLRTPLPAGASLADQARAHAALLDSLGIGQAIVVGLSAGAMSALELALLEPGRCRALILVSGVSQTIPRLAHIPLTLTPRVTAPLLNHDFFAWLVLKTIPRLAPQYLMSVTEEVAAGLTPADRAWLEEVQLTSFPTRPRRLGAQLDLEMVGHLPPVSFEDIRVPALVIHAVDDPTVPVVCGQVAAGRIPGAQALLLPRGGHLLLGQHDVVRQRIQAFLDRLPA
jgi:2-hydroxy-6-oxonona-2,4-dienedioate hydrolase